MACVSTKPVFGEAEMGNGLERAMAERRKWSKIVGSGVFGGRPGLCTMLKTIPKTQDAGDSVGDQESHKTQVERSWEIKTNLGVYTVRTLLSMLLSATLRRRH